MISKKKAEKEYEKYLRQIESKHGSKETNSTQLHKIGKRLFGKKFRGVFPSDMIPKMKGGEYAIVNLQNQYQPGDHWVATVKSKGTTYVYDSFGRKTFKILPELVQSGNGVILETENDPEQDLNGTVEENCGQRSFAFLKVYDKYGWQAAKFI